MTDLRARLREADRVHAPDLWPEIDSRVERMEVGPSEAPPPLGRAVLVATVAFALFAASALFAWQALHLSSNPRRPADEVPGASTDPWGSYGQGWTQLPAPPEVRQGATLAWAGKKLLSWGGVRPGDTEYAPTADGYAFDPTTGEWHPIPPAPLPGKFTQVVWTGTEAIFWGAGGSLDRGVAFDPSMEAWRTIAPSPHDPSSGGILVWTGSELIWWGGGAPGDPENSQGAAYDPATDTWRRIADAPIGLNAASGVWTGKEVIVFGSLLDSGNRPATQTSVGAAYDPATDTWRELPPSDLSPQAVAAVWLGGQMVTYDYDWKAEADGPAANAWSPLPSLPFRSGECYPDGAIVGTEVFAFGCGEAATWSLGEDAWRVLDGGLTDATIEANGPSYKLWRVATLVPAGDALAIAAEGITVNGGGTPCYGCEGSLTSVWVYRPTSPDTAATGPVDQVYLPPALDEREGWATYDSGPVSRGGAAVAWPSTVPFAEGDRSSGAAIPPSTIASLSAHDIVITVESTPGSFDPSRGPYPYDVSRFDLRTALRRGPQAEEPAGHYSVLEIDDPAALLRVYFGSTSPDDPLIERAQRELDTLQLPPVCPAPTQGGYGATLSSGHGAPGDTVTIRGPMPFQHEDGSYDTSADEVMIAWWNAAPDEWAALSSFSTASLSAVTGAPVIRLGEGGRGRCSFSIVFTIPDVPARDYLIVVLGEVPGGSALEASLTLRVDLT